MLSVNTGVHLALKVAAGGVQLNDLAASGRGIGQAVSCAVLARVLWTMQEEALSRVRAGRQELACPGCGVVHCGPGSLLRRGHRVRTVQTPARCGFRSGK